MLYLYILLNCTFFTQFSYSEHDIHLTKSLIEYNTEEQALQITLHIYLDDLESSLELDGAPSKLNLCTEKEHEKGETYVENYLRSKFQLNVNGQAIEYDYLGKEISEDLLATWCYIEVKSISKLESIQVKNTMLTELYDDQRNIVQIKVPNKKSKYFMLDNKYTEESVEY